MAADLEGYAKLVGEKFQYYVAKTTFILGRKAKKEHKLADNEEFFCISEQKNISRKHAIVTWDPKTKGWYLECRGKNGLHVNGKLVMPDNRKARLSDKAQIKISGVTVYFLLPKLK
ncbi:hypothetical protein AAMO2058_000738600 [Amorphochlora amoebiformis]|uniref:FHA domain-containing protein n=1 Tax=Amorphochlora amoebiformis TaxID=1561963 RepID=A0A7S0H4H5_9EUKA|mmetsp:Transcript_9719/g.15362  ORF Transcript_9719/g.15362 Transcript_9719/m.15362 type:complete len:116 (+) Transcript_9719:41-388(+)